MGDESLDVDEVGIGLDGAENMGQDGERGEVGLGFGGLQDITTKKLVSTQGNHSASTGGSGEAEWQGAGEAGGVLNPGCVFSAKSHLSRPNLHVFQVMPVLEFLGVVTCLFAPQSNCFLGDRSFCSCLLCLWPSVKNVLNPHRWVPTPTSYH